MNIYNGQKILVVEDNFMSFKLIEVHFKRSNLGVVHATDGLMALEKFREEDDIRAVLMDIQLPGINGLEVTREIRKMDSDVPVIATTGNVFEDDRLACMDAGCNYFLEKPLDFNVLNDIFEKHLNA